MRLTEFGTAVRHLRMRYDKSMKAMADAMNISSSHLSGIEYGEKTLAPKYIDGAISFFAAIAKPEELQHLRESGARSKDVVHVDDLQPDAKVLVAAFARRLQDGCAPSPEILDWLDKRSK